MPSRWANTGTRASRCTRSTRLLPPRGTITSSAPPRPSSISPTASREANGTREIAASGRPACLEAGDEAGVDRRRGMEAVRAAAQHHRVAGLEAQRAGVGGDVGPALVDDADDAERRRDALDRQPVRPLERRQHPADRIGQGGDLLEPARHRLDALGVERQPVDERRRRGPWRAPPRGRARWRRGFRRRARAGPRPRRAARAFLTSAGALASARAAARASAPIARIAARTSAAGATVSSLTGLDIGGPLCERGASNSTRRRRLEPENPARGRPGRR